jgi:hypothetical protein
MTAVPTVVVRNVRRIGNFATEASQMAIRRWLHCHHIVPVFYLVKYNWKQRRIGTVDILHMRLHVHLR